LWLTIYNPHIENSIENPPGHWTVESFFGMPVPPAIAPDGYQLDLVNATGFKISGRAVLTVEEALDRNGSSFIDPKEFTMAFPDPIEAGDVIEFRAPPGFKTQLEILGLYTEIVCNAFEWLPTIWPVNESNATSSSDEPVIKPPIRPPIPPKLPPWARGNTTIVFMPITDPNVTNSSNSSNSSNASNISRPAAELLEEAGMPPWAMEVALLIQNETRANATQNQTNETIVLRTHCLARDSLSDWGLPTFFNASFNWTSLPTGAELTLAIGEALNGTWNGSNITNFTNATHPGDMLVFCLNATYTVNATEIAPEARVGNCTSFCNGTEVHNVTEFHNLTNGTALCHVFCVTQEQLCATVPAEQVPTNGTNLSVAALRTLPVATCPPLPVNGTRAEQNLSEAQACGCAAGPTGAFLLEVFWRTPVNLSVELEEWRYAHWYALRLASFDIYPLQAQPDCLKQRMTFTIGEDDVHPEEWLMNRTVFRFKLGYQNPRRPPLTHENFWILRHRRKDDVEYSSSDAVPSWRVVSTLRYLRIDLLTEVLRPLDFAELHFEFVTVNPADRVDISANSPKSFGFADAFVSSVGTGDGRVPPAYEDRRLQDDVQYWQGFTSNITVLSKDTDGISLRVALYSREYTRFRLGGITIPWIGGQAFFTIFTSIRGLPQDEIQDCCLPGYPLGNPAKVFLVPNRLVNLRGNMKNEYQQNPVIYPIANVMDWRLDETAQFEFIFNLPVAHVKTNPAQPIVIVVRTPVSYQLQERPYTFMDTKTPPGAVVDKVVLRDIPTWSRNQQDTRVEVVIPTLDLLEPETEYRLRGDVRTPKTHSVRLGYTGRGESDDLWVLELTDTLSIYEEKDSLTLGSYKDFRLESQINFTVFAKDSPPEVVIEVDVTLIDLGETKINRVDIYAPMDYKFLLNCLKPGQDLTKLRVVSCRERWTLFNANYLSGAIMMTMDGGIPKEMLPLKITLLAKTPADTPATNFWYARNYERLGPLSWGIQLSTFPIRPMTANVYFPALSGSKLPLFLNVRMRYALPMGGHIHVAGPRLYQMHCPITKVIAGPAQRPVCTNEDPILSGCWGLPKPTDPNPPFGMPLCDPLHEMLLTYEVLDAYTTPAPPVGPTTQAPMSLADYTQVSNAPAPPVMALATRTANGYAVQAGEELLLALDVRVPLETPQPRSENVFRIRILDPSKVAMDGKLNNYGPQVREKPLVQDFNLWWSRPSPNVMITVAVEFTFNGTYRRDEELPNEVLTAIEIVAPEGLKMAVRRPRDVRLLNSGEGMPVKEWNWTDITDEFSRRLWFGLDTNKNISRTFHYAFPVLTPNVMPSNNLWQIKFCPNAPFCYPTSILTVPIPGFWFNEAPTSTLSDEATAILAGSPARRMAAWPPWPLPVVLAWVWLWSRRPPAHVL